MMATDDEASVFFFVWFGLVCIVQLARAKVMRVSVTIG